MAIIRPIISSIFEPIVRSINDPVIGGGTPTLAQQIQNGTRDGVYIDFVNDEAWVTDSVTPANNFTGEASTLLSKAYTPTADGAFINASGDQFTLPRASHNWSATNGTFFAEWKHATYNTSSVRSVLRLDTRYPIGVGGTAGLERAVRTINAAGTTRWWGRNLTVVDWQRAAVSLNSSGDFSISVSGKPVQTQSSFGTFPDADLFIGARSTGANELGGYVRSVMYLPEKVTDDELVLESRFPSFTYDVFILAGQSNMVGRALNNSTDTARLAYDINAWQLRQSNTIGEPTWLTSYDATDKNDLNHVDDGRNDSNAAVGIAHRFSTQYRVAVTGRGNRILFVPVATGGTGFASNNWNPGDPQYEYAIERANYALSLPNTTLKGILWHQGERDVFDGNTANYEDQLDAMIAAMRSDITGGTDCPFVLGGMVPSYVAAPVGGGTAGDAAIIQAIIEDTPNRVSNCAYASSATMTAGDGIHFDAASTVTMGERYYTAWASI